MSLVIAYAHKGVVYMGCDTQTNGGEERSTSLAESQRKIWLTDEGVPLLREKLEKSHFLTKEGFIAIPLAVASGGELFVINHKFAVIGLDEYVVLGSSRKIATGTLDYAEGSAEERIPTAFRAVENCAGYKRFPVVLCDNMTGKRIYKG